MLKNGSARRVTDALFYVVAIISIILVLMTQERVEYLAFEAIEVPTVAYVASYPNERFFDIVDPSVNRQEEAYGYSTRVTGKYNADFEIKLFLAYPFVDGNKLYWVGLSKRKSVSNHLSKSEKQEAVDQLKKRFYQEVHERRFDTDYGFRRLMPSDNRDGYIKSIKRATHLSDNEYEAIVILAPQNIEAMTEKDIPKAVFWIFGIGSVVIFLMVMFSKLDRKGVSNFDRPAVYFKETKSWIDSMLWGFKELPVTTTVIGINIIIFVIAVFQGVHFLYPSSEELYYFGAATQESLLAENYWQVISSCFVHGGLLHVVYNMFALFFVGLLLEQKMKPILYGVGYIAAGVFAVLSTLYFQEHVVLVGASGAIFGLFGVMLAFLIFKVYERGERSMVWFCLIVFGGVSLVIGFFTPNVGNIAHVSGLAFGFVLGSLFTLGAKGR